MLFSFCDNILDFIILWALTLAKNTLGFLQKSLLKQFLVSFMVLRSFAVADYFLWYRVVGNGALVSTFTVARWDMRQATRHASVRSVINVDICR